MPPPVYPKTVDFKGIYNLPFKIFTTTYPNFTSWDWAANSLEPMEFHGFISGGLPTGIWAQIIDAALASAYTSIVSGDNTLGDINDSVFGQGIIVANKLAGFGFASSGDLNPQTYSLPAILGVNISQPTFQTRTAISFPTGVPNTGAPLGGLIANMPGAGRSIFQYGEISLVPELLSIDAVNLASQDLGTTPDLGISNTFHGLNARYNKADGLTYINSGDPSSSTDRTLLETTNFQGATGIKYSLTYVDPPNSTINIDDLMTQHGNNSRMYPNYSGFGIVFKNTGTIDNVAVNGFAVLVAPDYSSYIVLNLIPVDGNTWLSNPGEYTMKFDSAGNFWMKNANLQQTLYISTGPVLRTLPVYPPIPLPGRKETDPAMTIIRSGYNGE